MYFQVDKIGHKVIISITLTAFGLVLGASIVAYLAFMNTIYIQDIQLDVNEICNNTEPNFILYLAHPKDCEKFYQCSNHKAFLRDCPWGLHFNQKEKVIFILIN